MQLKNNVGTWRSLGARLNGVQEVAGSNPVVPTKRYPGLYKALEFFIIKHFDLFCCRLFIYGARGLIKL